MLLKSNKLVLASGNAKKINELGALLAPLGVEVLTQSNFNVPEAEETGTTFIENAIIKARNASEHTGWAAIADDSGLEVDTLQGAPGVYSARYSGEHATDDSNNRKLLYELRGLPEGKRHARFHCALALMRHANDPAPLLVHRTWEGRILDAPSGEAGFGYDPLFFVPTHNQSSAELSADTKNAISHRGQAMHALFKLLKQHM